MHNMLSQFYNYLAEQILKYFSTRQIGNGDRFQVQFEKNDQVKGLYYALQRVGNGKEITYTIHHNPYHTYFLDFGVKLIVAATVDNVQPDYLTTLRNRIGNEAQFENSAILFIHNSSLDSIIAGSESLQQESMPLSPQKILGSLNEAITESRLSRMDKQVLYFALGDKGEELTGEEYSILLEYSDIINCINKDEIAKCDYRNFKLFYDNDAEQDDDTKTLERLAENAGFLKR